MDENQEKPDEKNKLLILLITLLVILILIFGLICFASPNKLKTLKSLIGINSTDKTFDQASIKTFTLDQSAPSDWQTFNNDQYRFSFKTPSDWQNKTFMTKVAENESGYFDYYFATKDSDPEMVKNIGVLIPEKYYSDSTIYTSTDFTDWADVNAGNCSADGPCAHASCNQQIDKTPFRTTTDITGYVYHVVYKVESCVNGPEYGYDGAACSCDKTENVAGPIYILNTYSATNGALRLIRVAPDILDSNTLKVTDDVWQKIVNSITFY